MIPASPVLDMVQRLIAFDTVSAIPNLGPDRIRAKPRSK